MATDIASDDVVRLILQFLRENNLHKTLAALQSESPVTFNTVENKSSFLQDIEHGRWDSVLRQVVKLKLPSEKLYNLYEQITLELVEQGEKSAARTVLSETDVMDSLREHDVDRYIRLDHLISRPTFDKNEAYPDGKSKEQRRRDIAAELSQEIAAVPRSRLLALLGQAIKWQQHQGALSADTAYDLFKGKALVQKAEDDAVATQHYCTITYPGKKTHAEHAAFSPNGLYLATGSVDGFIEIWNYMTGKLRKDLRYQAEDKFMAMDNAVLCLSFSQNNELLATGSADGKIMVWKVQKGTCQRKLSPAHSQGVTSVCFNKDGTLVLSGSHDQTAKIHGLRSGKTLKEFRGHTSFVNAVMFSNDNTRVLSASSDGTVKIWDAKTTSCLHTITPHPETSKGLVNTGGGLANHTVQSIVQFPKNIDQVLICTKSNVLYVMTMRGKIVKTYTHQKKGGSDFLAAALSPQGDIVYGLTEDSVLYAFQATTTKLISEVKICEQEAVGMASHPLVNTVVTYDDAGHVYFLKA